MQCPAKLIVALAAALFSTQASSDGSRGAPAAGQASTDRYAEIPAAKWTECKANLFDARGKRVDTSKMFDLAMDSNFRECAGMAAIDRRYQAAETAASRQAAPKANSSR